MSDASEKSARQTHLLRSARETLCGIRFKHRRFFERNVTGYYDLCECLSCSAEYQRLGRVPVFFRRAEVRAS